MKRLQGAGARGRRAQRSASTDRRRPPAAILGQGALAAGRTLGAVSGTDEKGRDHGAARTDAFVRRGRPPACGVRGIAMSPMGGSRNSDIYLADISYASSSSVRPERLRAWRTGRAARVQARPDPRRSPLGSAKTGLAGASELGQGRWTIWNSAELGARIAARAKANSCNSRARYHSAPVLNAPQGVAYKAGEEQRGRPPRPRRRQRLRPAPSAASISRSSCKRVGRAAGSSSSSLMMWPTRSPLPSKLDRLGARLLTVRPPGSNSTAQSIPPCSKTCWDI